MVVKKGLIFDYGGVFVHSPDGTLFDQIGEAFDLDPNVARQAINPLMYSFFRGQKTEEDFWEQFSASVGRPLPRGYETLWTSQIRKAQPDPRMVALHTRVKEAGYRTVVLSDIIDPLAKFLKERGDFSIFDGQVLSCDIGFKKPQPHGYRIALESLGVKSDEADFVDDKLKYLAGAEAVGIRGHHYVQDPENPEGSIDRLESSLRESGYVF